MAAPVLFRSPFKMTFQGPQLQFMTLSLANDWGSKISPKDFANENWIFGSGYTKAQNFCTGPERTLNGLGHAAQILLRFSYFIGLDKVAWNDFGIHSSSAATHFCYSPSASTQEAYCLALPRAPKRDSSLESYGKRHLFSYMTWRVAAGCLNSKEEDHKQRSNSST